MNKRIYTCTPVPFHGNKFFFSRDSGLFCRSLKKWGAESKVIMPLPGYDEDEEDVLRADYRRLESPDWWKSLNLDSLILYSWAAPRYRNIARAIHLAGIHLVIHLDMSANLHTIRNGSFYSYIRDIAVNFFRARHMSYADVLTCSLPLKETLYEDIYYGKSIADKCLIVPSPVASHFFYDSSMRKERKVVCVGRWSGHAVDQVKRPGYLLETVRILTLKDPKIIVEIYGKCDSWFLSQYNKIEANLRDRIQLMGFIENTKLPHIYQKSQVAICTSRSEGTHIASLEALCCGCSIVIPSRKQLQTLHWYASYNSGTISSEDTPESMSDAILTELQLWESGQREPKRFATFFQDMVRVDKVVQRLFGRGVESEKKYE